MTEAEIGTEVNGAFWQTKENIKSTLEMKSTNHNTTTFFQETGLLLLWSLVADVYYQVSDMASSRISLCHWYFFYDSSKSGTMYGPKFISEADTWRTVGEVYDITTCFMSLYASELSRILDFLVQKTNRFSTIILTKESPQEFSRNSQKVDIPFRYFLVLKTVLVGRFGSP